MLDYENVLEENDQKRRIEIVLTDAYGEHEQQEAFCCYLEDHVSFPFKAILRDEKKPEIFTVLRFRSMNHYCIVCEVDINGTRSRVPLTEIVPVERDSTNYIVIGDYLHYMGI